MKTGIKKIKKETRKDKSVKDKIEEPQSNCSLIDSGRLVTFVFADMIVHNYSYYYP